MTKRTFASGVLHRNAFPRLLAVAILALSQGVYSATTPEPVTYSHKDWDLICDNTLTCRAAGYSDDGTETGSNVLLVRQAGQSTSVSNRVKLADYDGETAAKNPGAPALLTDNRSQGKLTTASDDNDSWEMNATQYAAFMQALRRDSKISFRDKLKTYSFSGEGASAVLLKMDEVQGRVGTPSALIRKGHRSETDVKQPVPEPVIVRAPVRDKESRKMTSQEAALIKPALMKRLAADSECQDEQLKEEWRIAQLNNKQSLVSASCWFGAYQGADVYFVIDNDMAEPAVMVTESANYYEDGILSSSMKDRGLGDCWNHEEFVWDGKHFVLSSAGDTGRCRLIRAGGAWDIPAVVSRVILSRTAPD